MIKIEKEILHFLTQESQGRPFLLGLSGGPDSTFLFHLLLRLSLPFEVAHVNHFWRPESSQEASFLAEKCRAYEVPFHLYELDLQSLNGNLEDACRIARQAFFRRICSERHLTGVILGHHADDQAETVLKRVFEGASLSKLKGLTLKTYIGELAIFRPLLGVRKEKMIAWLEENNLPYFTDPTNTHPSFLRGRMRNELLPILSNHFGKHIAPSLCRLGESAFELHEFLEELLEPYREQIEQNASSVTLDFNKKPPRTAFLWKAVVRDFFDRQSMTVSNRNIETIVFHLQTSKSLKIIRIGKEEVQMHRGILSFTKSP